MRSRSILSLGACFAASLTFAQVTLNQVDDFQDGTVMSWAGGSTPTNIASGGPLGASDKYLQISSIGGFLATFNNIRWNGDYTAAGVNRVEVDLKNTGAVELSVRMVLFKPGGMLGDRWSSNQVVILSPNSAWTHAVFDLKEANFTQTVGSGTFASLLATMDRIMWRHEPVITSGGTAVVGTLGIDNVAARFFDSNSFTFTTNKVGVAGQNSVLGTITLGETKPQNTVLTTFDDSSLVITPPSVTVLAGQLSRNFQITTQAITSTVNTTISARLGAVTKTRPLALLPLIPTALQFTPSAVTGGQSLTCRVVINGVAGAGGRDIAIFDNSAYATVPGLVTVPPGATQVIFTINTTTPPGIRTCIVTARVSAGEKTGPFRINP